MKFATISMMMANIITFNITAQPEIIQLPKSGSVALRSSVVEDSLQYEVLFKKASGEETNLSLVKVKIKGNLSTPQDEVRYLIACDENSDMVVVLMATDPWGLILLQYDLTTKVAREERLAAVKLMDYRRESGGTLSVNAPNRITLSNPNGTSQTWSVVDERMFDENGNVFAQHEEGTMGFLEELRTAETTSQRIKAASGSDNFHKHKSPSLPKTTEPKSPVAYEEPTSSRPWTIIVVLILVAIGMLLLLKKRI